MSPRHDEALAQLEAEVAADPESEEARVRFLDALCSAGHLNDPRRLAQIAWLIEHNPRHINCRTPYCHVDPEAAPDAFVNLKRRWLEWLASEPDSEIARGAAAFVAAESLDEAKRILRNAIERDPDEPALWLDLGRASEDPQERLFALERAAALGETSPNLLVWIAKAAFEAGDLAKAERAARELMTLVHDARLRFGDKLEWPERGTDLWRRAKATCGSSAAAHELTDAIAQHAYRLHWAHTILGLLAADSGDIDQAVVHLRASANIRSDYRLSAYGPALDLLRTVCTHGRWDAGLEYLQAWEKVWADDRVKAWLAAVREQRLP